MDVVAIWRTLDPVAIGLLALLVALLGIIVFWVAWLGQRRLLQRYRRLLYGPKGVDLEAILLGQAATIDALRNRVEAMERALERQGRAAVRHIQHIGIVRFQAFPEMGSDLSFSVALLDGDEDGVVLTSLYGRTESRIYAKPIVRGSSTYTLTDEERTALARALEEPE